MFTTPTKSSAPFAPLKLMGSIELASSAVDSWSAYKQILPNGSSMNVYYRPGAPIEVFIGNAILNDVD